MTSRTIAGAAAASALLLPALPGRAADIIVIDETRTVTASAEGCDWSPDGPVCNDDFDQQTATSSLPFSAEVTANAPYAFARALQISYFETDHIAIYGELEATTSADSCILEQWSNAGASTEFMANFEVTDATPFTLFAALGTLGSPPGVVSVSLIGPGVNETSATQGDSVLPVVWSGTFEPGTYTLTVGATHNVGDLAGGRTELSCLLALTEVADPGPPGTVTPLWEERHVSWESVHCDWQGCVEYSDAMSADDFDFFSASIGGAMQLSLVNPDHFSAIGRVSVSVYALTDAGEEASAEGSSTYDVLFTVPEARHARVRAIVGGGATVELARQTPPVWTVSLDEQPFQGFAGVVDLAPGTYTVHAGAQASAAAGPWSCVNHAWDDGAYVLTVDFFEDTGPDFNWDGVVNGADLGLLLAVWGPCPGCPEDLNGDGVVDGMDLGLLLAEWG